MTFLIEFCFVLILILLLVTQVLLPLLGLGNKRYFWLFRKPEKVVIENLNKLEEISVEECVIESECKVKEALKHLEESKKKLEE